MIFGGRKNNKDPGAIDKGKNHYFCTQSFQKNCDKIKASIGSLPYKEIPDGWVKHSSIAIGGLEYIGFSDDSHYILIVSSSGRGVLDLASGEFVARDRMANGEWLDESNLVCQGIGPLNEKTIRITGIGGGGLPSKTSFGDSLYLAASLFPCYEVVYQPPYQNCLIDGHNKDCVIIYRGYISYCGFSWDGKILVVVDEDINIWCRNKI